MFMVKPKTDEDFKQALFILSYYRVSFEALSDGEHASSVYLVVNTETRRGDLEMCRKAFCLEFESHEDEAGHLVFDMLSTSDHYFETLLQEVSGI